MLELKVTCTGDFSNGTTVQESISFPGQHLHESQTVLYCTVLYCTPVTNCKHENIQRSEPTEARPASKLYQSRVEVGLAQSNNTEDLIQIRTNDGLRRVCRSVPPDCVEPWGCRDHLVQHHGSVQQDWPSVQQQDRLDQTRRGQAAAIQPL